MIVQVDSSDVALSAGVFAPDGTERGVQPNPAFDGQLPATVSGTFCEAEDNRFVLRAGAYTIIHGPRRSEVATFEFTVTIPPLGAPRLPPPCARRSPRSRWVR
jgi:hypothetical protein